MYPWHETIRPMKTYSLKYSRANYHVSREYTSNFSKSDVLLSSATDSVRDAANEFLTDKVDRPRRLHRIKLRWLKNRLRKSEARRACPIVSNNVLSYWLWLWFYCQRVDLRLLKQLHVFFPYSGSRT
jgi:hypothetical protein